MKLAIPFLLRQATANWDRGINAHLMPHPEKLILSNPNKQKKRKKNSFCIKVLWRETERGR